MGRKVATITLLSTIAALSLLMPGCAAHSRSVRFTEDDVKRIPGAALRRILLPSASDEVVVVRARGQAGPAAVESIAEDGRVIVKDAKGNEARLAIDRITEIARIQTLKRADAPAGTHQGSALEAAGEALILAPLVPVAIVSWPFLGALGLDEEKNSQDREKALLAYGSMSREAVREGIGAPQARYYCRDSTGRQIEVWSYDATKVLRGGRFLFFNSADGTVYFTSIRFPGQADCMSSPTE